MCKSFNNAQPGDFAVVNMNLDGFIIEDSKLSINSKFRKFEIIIVNGSSILVSYKEEALFGSNKFDSLNDFVLYDGAKVISNVEKYYGDWIRWLNPSRVQSFGPDPAFHRGGCNCKVCKEFYDYAVPNQPDGKTLICWSCRQNPMRA